MWGRFVCRQARRDAVLSAAHPLSLLFSNDLSFLPLPATTVVCTVRNCSVARLKLLLWAYKLTRQVAVLPCHAPWCVAAVTQRVSKVVAEFALQLTLGGIERLRLNSQTTELGE
jgi:hypothetical protein